MKIKLLSNLQLWNRNKIRFMQVEVRSYTLIKEYTMHNTQTKHRQIQKYRHLEKKIAGGAITKLITMALQ